MTRFLMVVIASLLKVRPTQRRIHFLQFSVYFCLLGLIFLVALPALADPINGKTDDCTKPGIIIEKNFFGIAKNFTVNITDKDNGGKVVMQIPAGVIPAGGSVAVFVPPPGNGVMHCDAFNTSVAVPNGPGPAGGGPGNVKAGAQQQFKIEVLFTDPNTLQVDQGSIFDFVDQAYPGQTLLLPDLWGDTSGDGEIDGADFLYSLIDLNAYTLAGADPLAVVNARWSPGQAFNIINGQVAGLPGMMFSTTDFTFTPSGGYQGTPYTGTGYTVTDHELTTPEPSAGALALLAATALLGSMRDHGRRRGQ